MKKALLQILFLLPFCSLILSSLQANAQSLEDPFFDIGTPNVTDYYVDPSTGNDNNNGTEINKPKRTVTDIWNSIPENSSLTKGYRINLLPGTYTSDHLPNYWENKTGTSTAPLILQSASGYGTVYFTRDINMAGTSYFYLLGVDIKNITNSGYGDAFHCERCNHILLRGNSFNGAPNGRTASGDIAHETVKFNQSQYVYIENNNIQGADDNGIDWVSVQYGHIRANRIHDTNGWCMYVKGGSSYILVESNIAYSCGEGGITAGQGTGFEFMESPWLRFEANYVKIVNNIIHDIEGAAIGVNGGYGILVAHNTAYKIGTRSHLLEVVFGERSCDGDTALCTVKRNQGGWGPVATGSENSQPIGNQDVIILNNILYNPAGTVSGSQHFAIYGPRTPSVGSIPSPQKTDTGLIIKGNLIWNGSNSMPLGIEDSDQGCQAGNPTCSLNQLTSENTINTSEPDFLDPASEDFRPTSAGIISGIISATIPNIPAIDSTLNPIDEGNTNDTMVREFSGTNVTSRPPGAFSNSNSSIGFPSSGESGTTPGGGSGGSGNLPPILIFSKSSAVKNGKKVIVNVTATATDSDGVKSVTARIMANGTLLKSINLKQKKGKYSGKANVKTSVKKLDVSLMAVDNSNYASTKTKTLKIKSS
jgi:hypothetical protein